MLASDKSSWHREEEILFCLFGLIFSADNWSLDLLLGLGDCVEIVCNCVWVSRALFMRSQTVLFGGDDIQEIERLRF